MKKGMYFSSTPWQKSCWSEREGHCRKVCPDLALTNDLIGPFCRRMARKKELKIYADGKEKLFQQDSWT